MRSVDAPLVVLANEYMKHTTYAARACVLMGRFIMNALRDIIPDLYADGELDGVYLYSASHSVKAIQEGKLNAKECVSLTELIKEIDDTYFNGNNHMWLIFKNNEGDSDVYVPRDKVEQVRKRLLLLFGIIDLDNI